MPMYKVASLCAALLRCCLQEAILLVGRWWLHLGRAALHLSAICPQHSSNRYGKPWFKVAPSRSRRRLCVCFEREARACLSARTCKTWKCVACVCGQVLAAPICRSRRRLVTASLDWTAPLSLLEWRMVPSGLFYAVSPMIGSGRSSIAAASLAFGFPPFCRGQSLDE